MTPVWDPKQLVRRTTHSVSTWAPRHVFLFNKKACPLVQQEDMSSCSTRRHVFLLNRKTWLLFQLEDMSSSFLLNRMTCLLVQQEDMSSCRTGRHVFLPVEQEGMSSGWTRRHLLAEREDMSSCWTRRHVFLLNKRTCLVAHMDTERVVLKINCLGSHPGVMEYCNHHQSCVTNTCDSLAEIF